MRGHLVRRRTAHDAFSFFFNRAPILSRTFVRLSVQRILEIKKQNKRLVVKTESPYRSFLL